MQTQRHATKFTYEDYLLFPDDGRRHEIIDGEHYVTPSPVTKHQRVSLRLATAFQSAARGRNVGEVLAAPMDVVLSDLDVVQPDLLYVSAARAAIVREKNVQGAPDLIVEILSESTRKTDEIVKRKLYERCGVREYWIVDPEVETVKIYRLTGKAYKRTAELSRETGDTITTPLLSKLKISLRDLFG
jgi:Uma2 family endonuclease